MNFLMLGTQNVAIVKDNNALYNALLYRVSPNCLVYASADIAPLYELAQHQYQHLCFLKQPDEVLTLPGNTGNGYTVAVQDQRQSQQNMITNTRDETWIIIGLNGFKIVNQLKDLLTWVASGIYIYPIAMWCGDPGMAMQLARREYGRRFFSHFDGRVEQLWLSDAVKNEYVDPYFSQREQRRNAMSEAAKQFQYIMQERVW